MHFLLEIYVFGGAIEPDKTVKCARTEQGNLHQQRAPTNLTIGEYLHLDSTLESK